MKLTEEVSSRINALRFPMIVSFVMHHAIPTEIRFREGGSAYTLSGIPAFITQLFGNTVGWVAMPVFFLISGLLFYKNFEPALPTYKKKLRGRLRTLLIPYLFWNICIFSVLLVVHHIGSFSTFFSGAKWAVPDSGVYAILDRIIGIDRPPIVYPLWFIRDLMLVMIISPLLWMLATRRPLAGVLIFGVLWFAEGRIPLIVFNHYDALLFFYCGCLLARSDVDLQSLERQRGKILLAFGCGIFLTAYLKTVNTLDATFWMNAGATNVWEVGVFKATALVGVLAVWSVFATLRKKTWDILQLLSTFAFIVYAAHEPTLTIVKKLLYRLVPPSGEGGVLFYYFLTAGVAILMTILLGMVLSRYTPRFYGFITGARV